MRLLIYLCVVISTFAAVRCYKILGIFPSPGYSQFIMCEKLMKELASRGHEVTVITPYKPKVEVKNHRTILTDGIIGGSVVGNSFQRQDSSIFTSIFTMYMFGSVNTEYILSHPEVQELIHSNATFDAVLVEMFLNEAHLGFAKHFNAPLILFSSVGLSEWTSPLVGNPRPLSYEASIFSPYTNHMTFLQRAHNTMLYLFQNLCNHLLIYPKHQKYLTKYFPNDMKLNDVMYNASLLLLNSHPTTAHPSALTSAVVEICGFHLTPKKLPNDLQTFLDGAKDGAIFFSLGSNVRTEDMPDGTLQAVLRVFSKLKQRVLWKFHKVDLPNKPDNVLISKWLPQTDILAHPNTVVFITHAGYLSTVESIYFGVPMLGIPIFGDQMMNIARSVERGVGVYLPFKNLSEDTLQNTLKEIIENPKYRKTVKEISAILKDRVVKPLDLAMYWIEFIIRHPTAREQFRNAAMDLPWYKLYLVDVALFFLICSVALCYLIRLLLRYKKYVFRSRTQSDASKKKN